MIEYLDVDDVRARVASLLRKDGLEYLGPSDDSPWPEYDGECCLVMVQIRERGLFGLYRAGRPRREEQHDADNDEG